MSSRSILGWSLVFGIATAGAGCKVYDPSLVGGGSSCAAGELGCLPARPDASTSSATDSEVLLFALRDVYLNQQVEGVPLNDTSQPWRRIGLNLDGLDTTLQSSAGSCLTPNGDPAPLDGENGIDNVFGSKIYSELITIAAPTLQDDICCYMGQGVGTLILRIAGWNGTRNDASVEIGLLLASDGTSENPSNLMWDATRRGVVHISDSSPAAPPSWGANTDTYYISPSTIVLNQLDSPKHVDDNGYITNGTFVMRISEQEPLRLYLGAERSIGIRLIDGSLVGTMSSDFNQVDQGIMGGRMGRTGLQEASAGLFATTILPGQCGDILPVIDPVIEQFADLRVDKQNDTDLLCDAMSVGVDFHAIRVNDIRVAGNSVCFPYPDCDGNGATTCEPLSNVDQNAAVDPGPCTFGGDPSTCSIPAFVPSTGGADAGVDAGIDAGP